MANQVVEKGSDPRSLITSLHWRNFIDSQWKDANYKRRAIASLIQAVYLLEQDRQEKRTQENSLAPEFWIPLKYKLTQILIDERDGSIFGAIFEWDRLAALSEFKPFKPIGAPRAVLALRGTLIRVPTMRRDFVDGFRFVAWESLKDSVRFKVATYAVKSVCDKYGSRNVCIAGHSLGAGFGLQVGKELAKERVNVETHAFNPPSVSLAMSLGNIGEKAEYVLNRIKYILPSGIEAEVNNSVDETYIIRLKKMIPRLSCLMDTSLGIRNWVPHIYVNKNDWISYFYILSHGTKEEVADVEKLDPTIEQNEAKLFVVSMEDQKFLEAHGLKQWWSNDSNVELKHGNHNNKLISMQLKSLNASTPSQVVLFYYPRYVSLPTSCINIREASDYVWISILKCMPRHISGKAQINNDGDVSSGIGLVSWNWIPSLSGLKNTGYWVCKWIPRMYVGAEEKMVGKENMDPEDGQVTPKLLIFSKL
ncbi:GDSL esterase/lipase At4g10955-like [Vicia villosa]|uniref:GDSL esterase/lipase At4g10955-like n=1 Tax=Vicia villosa TaxID=3911 RepID=UPI00273CAE7D|nr:GDSL esterase/lipase At4g10955-like [Vicia villosa]